MSNVGKVDELDIAVLSSLSPKRGIAPQLP
jgi:hypothetical protein